MEQEQRARRDRALANLRRILAVKNADETRRFPIEERRRIRAEYLEAAREYYKTLPQVEISRCPYDQMLVKKRMDIFGIDGPWWDIKGWDEPPAGDSHVVTYNGALLEAEKLVNQVPSDAEIHIGPAVPYVIPRLLSKEGVVCVIARISVLRGAYLMTYFANPILPGEESSEPWLRRMYYYTDEQGSQRWNVREDPMDFDIAKWLDQGGKKIYWIAPGDTSMTLVTGGPSQCPYVNMPGSRSPRVMKHNGLSLLPAPTGASVIDMFD